MGLYLGASSVGGKDFVNVKDTPYGATGDGVTDDTAAIQAAIDAVTARGGGRVILPTGTYRVTSNVNGASFLVLEGEGFASWLKFENSGLVFTEAEKFAINSLQASRTGTVGDVVNVSPGTVNGCRRWSTRDVNITGSTGNGWHLRDTWIVHMDNPIIAGCVVGLKVENGPLFQSAANAVTISGGETHANATGWSINGVKGWSISGHAIEGNTAIGADFTGTNRDVKLDAVYFEGNAGYDISYDSNPNGGYGLSLDGCGFLGTAASGPRAILLTRGQTVRIDQCSFEGYTAIPVLVNETPAASTSGVVSNCRTDSSRSVEVTASTLFGEPVVTATAVTATAASGVRTEFPLFPVIVPVEAANSVVLSASYVTTVAAGNVYMGVALATSAGVTFQTLATAIPSTAGALGVASWTVDLGAYRGSTVLVHFRRMGENALDTYTGGFTYYEGRATVRYGYRAT